MKIKSVLVAILINFLAVSSLFAMPPHEYYKPELTNEELLERCKSYARMLEYDDSKIKEAYFVTLPNNILGKACPKEDGSVILINRNVKWWNNFDFDENIVHEICHVYTENDLEWHIAMVRASTVFHFLKVEILKDEATDHSLD